MKKRIIGITLFIAICLIFLHGTVRAHAANSFGPPVIITQPKNVDIAMGDSATFKVGVRGQNVSWQWQVQKGSSWVDCTEAGANTETITVTGENKWGSWKSYRCRVSNESGEVYSNLAHLREWTPIESVDVKITPPAIGAAQDFEPVLPEGVHYYCEEILVGTNVYKNVTWYDETTDDAMAREAVFQPGYRYSVSIRLLPEKGYAFRSETANTLNGKKGSSHTYGSNRIAVSFNFPALCWVKKDGKWYHYPEAAMGQTVSLDKGLCTIDGVGYYFDADGVMQTGWQKVFRNWYYFRGSGAMVTGWQTINKKTYYFKRNGQMAEREWCGGWWLSANGAWTYPYKGSWKKNSKGWWFGDTSGWYAKSETVRINDRLYKFDARGYLVEDPED